MFASIKSKFLTLFIFLIILPLLVMGIAFSVIYKVKIEERILIEQNTILEGLYSEVIVKHIDQMEVLLTAISSNKELYTVFENESEYNIVMRQWDYSRILFPERNWIYYATKDNQLIISPYWEPPEGYTVTERPWFIAGSESEEIHWTEPYIEYVEHDIIVSATKGIKDSSGNFTGVLSVDTSANIFLHLLQEAAVDAKTELIVVSSDGTTVSLNDSFNSNNSTFDWEDFLALSTDNKTMKVGDKTYYHRYIYLDRLQMYIVSLMPSSVVIDETAPVLNLIYVLFIVGIILAMVAGIYTSNNIIIEVLDASRNISKIAHGDYRRVRLKKRNDEFSTLNTNINLLVDKISCQILELKDVNNQLDTTLKKKEELVELRTSMIHLLSHNSASPLTFLYNATHELLDNNSAREDLKMIHGAVRDIKSLNENIMTYVKLDEGIDYVQNEHVDLLSLTEIIVKNFAYQYAEKQLTIDVNQSSTSLINSNYFLVKMILENLIDNAIKYSYIGSKIDIKINKSNQKLSWEIQDGGPGFSEDDKKLIFGKFQKLSARPTGGEGSVGLGLYLVKQLSQNVDAEIVLDNATKTGAKFILTFNSNL